MVKEQVLQEIKSRLRTAYGSRLRGVVLYGSEARGQARMDSDIDLLVLLDDPVDYGQDLETNLRALYSLSLSIGRRISAKPVPVDQYEVAECPLYVNAHLEGVTL